MKNQYDVQYKPSTIDGRMGVSTPFNQKFVDELKRTVPSAKFERKYDGPSWWFFDEEQQDDVVRLVTKYFIDVKWMRVEIELDREDSVSVDGCNLAYINRDYFRWSSDMKFRIVEDEVETGGSRRNPHLSGRAVVDVLMRPDAEICPEPASVTDAPAEEERPNPLAAYPVAELAAELLRREAELESVLTAAGWHVIRPTEIPAAGVRVWTVSLDAGDPHADKVVPVLKRRGLTVIEHAQEVQSE